MRHRWKSGTASLSKFTKNRTNRDRGFAVEHFAATIRNTPLFAGLARGDLARIAGRLEAVQCVAGQTIVAQGERGDALYVVHAGAAEVVVEHDDIRIPKGVLGPGECFGEMSLMTAEPRSATVIALVESVLLKLSQESWEDLLAKHPSLSLHVCKVLSRRLTATEQEFSKDRRAAHVAIEEFFAAQSAPDQVFLIQTSALRTIDPEAIASVLSISDATHRVATLASRHPGLLRVLESGEHAYLDYFRDFLSAKQAHRMTKQARDELHLRFASYFSTHAQWAPAIHHYIQAEAWEKAFEHLQAHANALLESEPPKDILKSLEALPPQAVHSHGYLARLRVGACVRLGDLDGAIRTYHEFLAHKQVTAAEGGETSEYYQELVDLYQKKGETAEALGSLRLALGMLEEGRTETQAIRAIQSIGVLQQKGGSQESALHWGERALTVARKLGAQTRGGVVQQKRRQWLGVFLAVALASGLWQMSPSPPLDERGVHFLATLAAGVILWIFMVFDDYVIAIMLLLAWLLLGVVPSEVALAGFSSSSWFLFLGALGMGAAVIKSGLLYRVALQVLRRLQPNYKAYSVTLATSGLLATPCLPSIVSRIAIMAPVSQAMSEVMGFKPRSNGSAGLVLSAYVGFSQVSFMFLTGATSSLFGWSLLPHPARSEFGWGNWVLAALPAGMFILVVLMVAIHLFFPLKGEETPRVSPQSVGTQLEVLGRLSRSEWLSLAVLVLAAVGWLGKPFFGIGEAWVALGAFLVFLMTGVMDKKGLKNDIDWGFLLFMGVVSGLSAIMPSLHVDRWIVEWVGPILSVVSFHPLPFLVAVTMLVYLVRFFVGKFPTIVLFTLVLAPWAQDVGIHPGVLLLAILMAVETWFFPYQTPSYLLAYYSTDEKAFSHAQGRKLMVAKFVASLLAVAISVPYWRMLGWIH